MTMPRGTRRLTSARQVEAASSPVRVELLEHLYHLGPASVADLARSTGRPVTGVHYHVNLLAEAGMVKRAGTRPTGKRGEALYEVAAERFAAGAADAGVGVLAATLRLTQREAARALRAGDLVGDGPRRNFHAVRMNGPVSPDVQRRVNRLLDEIQSLFVREVKRHARARRSGAGPEPAALLSLTVVLAPAPRKEDRR